MTINRKNLLIWKSANWHYIFKQFCECFLFRTKPTYTLITSVCLCFNKEHSVNLQQHEPSWMPSFNGKVDLQIPQFLNICVLLLINKFFYSTCKFGSMETVFNLFWWQWWCLKETPLRIEQWSIILQMILNLYFKIRRQQNTFWMTSKSHSLFLSSVFIVVLHSTRTKK